MLRRNWFAILFFCSFIFKIMVSESPLFNFTITHPTSMDCVLLCARYYIRHWKYKQKNQPGLVWLSWLDIIPQSEKSPVQSQVKAQAWVVGSVSSRGTYKRQPISDSFPLFLPTFSSLYI